MDAPLSHVMPLLQQGGYIGIGLFAFLETSAFVGLLVPGETAVVLAGLLAAQGVLHVMGVIAAAAIGAVLGDSVGYYIGHRWGLNLFTRYGRFGFTPDSLHATQAFFARHGGTAIFWGRFVGWLRAFAPVVAGMAQMPYPQFLFYNALGGIAWALTFVLIGYFLGASWQLVTGYLGWVGAGAVLVVGLVFFFHHVLRTTQHLRQGQETLRAHLLDRWRDLDARMTRELPGLWGFVKQRFVPGEWAGLHLTVSLVLILLSLAFLGEVVEQLAERKELFVWDLWVQEWVATWGAPQTTRWMVWATGLGSVRWLLGASLGAILLLVSRRDWQQLRLGLLVTGGGLAVMSLGKYVFHRPRPLTPLVDAVGWSFPSGHALMAVLFYGWLLYLVWTTTPSKALRRAAAVILGAVILMVGWSRLYLQVHWLTDILAGYAAGLAWLVTCVTVVRLWPLRPAGPERGPQGRRYPMEPLEESSARETSRAGSVLALGWVFLRIGAIAFGGLGAALALVERDLVDKRRWLTPADLTEALTYTKLLPGSTVVQVVSYLGYKLGGWPGSALATAAFVLPSALAMLVLAALYVAATALPALGPPVNGLTAAVVGILLATTYRLGKANIKDPVALGMAVVACGVGVWFGVNAAFIVVAAGLLGIPLFATESTPTQRAKERGA